MIEPVAWSLMAAGVVLSAIVVKEYGAAPPMVRLNDARIETVLASVAPVREAVDLGVPEARIEDDVVVEVLRVHAPEGAEIRWFDGRPVRPARTIRMTVTGYSPDARSCGEFADGKTATLHSVWTNAMQLVAADPRVLPYGSMLTIPGYAGGEIVPVLDCGGAIKGNRLDVLFPSHGRARTWGVQRLTVTVWEYADGLPAPNPRKTR